MIRTLFLAIFCLGLFDCLEATQITVVVTTNASCMDLRTTTLAVGQLGALEQSVPVSSRDGCEAPPTLIGSVVVTPSGKNDAPVAFRVVTGVKKNAEDCTPPDYKGCIVARRALSYAPHQPLRVNVRMDLSCLDVPCGELETCSNGLCVPAMIPDTSRCKDPQGCDPIEGDAGPDAAMMPDTGPDTGIIDTGIDTGIDAGDSGVTPQEPLACFTVTDGSGTVGSPFALDASCSSDLLDPPNQLQVRWDFESDGVWDTQFTTTKTAMPTYANPGFPSVTLEVKNSFNLSATTSHTIAILAVQNDVVVTTQIDESDANATPSVPGGTGLSLREAIAYVNGLGQARVIRFKGPMTITTVSKLPALTAANASIIGGPGVNIDMNNVGSTNAACLDLSGAGQKMAWISATNCPGYIVSLNAASTQVMECRLSAGTSKGRGVQMNSTNELLGPHNDISGFVGMMNANAYGVFLFNDPKPGKHTVDGNTIRTSWVGIATGGWTNQVITRNTIVNNSTAGIQMFALDNGTIIRSNTIDGNTGDGIHIPNNVTASDIRDNILSNNGGYGIGGVGASFVDPNGFFGNALGAMSSGSPNMTSTTADPLFINRAAGNYRLSKASPCIDKGIDLGLDLNGPLPTNFNGSAPDLGAWEF